MFQEVFELGLIRNSDDVGQSRIMAKTIFIFRISKNSDFIQIQKTKQKLASNLNQITKNIDQFDSNHFYKGYIIYLT